MEMIREKLQILPETGNCTLPLIISWDPCGFIAMQEYECSAEQAIETALTTTGTVHHAQALPVRQYLEETWKDSFSDTMEMIKAMVRTPSAQHQWSSSDNPDNQLHGELKSGQCLLQIVGHKEFIIHTAQQFAWLGAGLRSSTEDQALSTCETIFENISSCEPGKFLSSITYKLREVKPNDRPPWFNMFRYAVVVVDFPVPQCEVSGLELPLNVAATLVGTRSVQPFRGKLFAMGFSACLMAEEAVNEGCKILVWQYCFRKDGKRLSYNDFQYESELGGNPNKIPGFDDVESYRHIIRSSRAV
ncbi:hypothetical protein N7448_011437 [Penicillium atrosanguineum]|nr:hypothetical protein N7448_011437 [Penicillium atrosanguineum]